MYLIVYTTEARAQLDEWTGPKGEGLDLSANFRRACKLSDDIGVGSVKTVKNYCHY